MTLLSLRDLTDPLQRFAQPPRDASNNPTQPPIRTFVVGIEPGNSNALARAGSGQAFVVGAQAPAGSSADVSERIVDALRRVVARPLGCQLDLPGTAPGSNEPIDRERVRVKLRSADGATNELRPPSAAREAVAARVATQAALEEPEREAGIQPCTADGERQRLPAGVAHQLHR